MDSGDEGPWEVPSSPKRPPGSELAPWQPFLPFREGIGAARLRARSSTWDWTPSPPQGTPRPSGLCQGGRRWSRGRDLGLRTHSLSGVVEGKQPLPRRALR